jgi:hypothetical protein
MLYARRYRSMSRRRLCSGAGRASSRRICVVSASGYARRLVRCELERLKGPSVRHPERERDRLRLSREHDIPLQASANVFR